MKFNKIIGINLYSFKNFELDFSDYAGLTTIILGKNIDDKTANGAGKTSFLKLIYYAIFNADLNGDPIDNVINRSSDNGGVVIFEFSDKGKDYKITRYRNFKKDENFEYKLHNNSPINGTGLEFLIDGEPLHGDTPASTQKIIEQKFSLSQKLFKTAVLTPQDAKNHFLTVDDTEKKELLSELLDLQKYSKGFENIKKSILEKNEQITLKEKNITQYKNQKDHLEKEIIKIDQNKQDFLENQKQNIKKLEELIEDEKKETAKIENALAQINLIDLKPYINRINEKQKELQLIKNELSEETELLKAEAKEKQNLINLIDERNKRKIKIDLMSSELKVFEGEELKFKEKYSLFFEQKVDSLIEENFLNNQIIHDINAKRELINLSLKDEVKINLQIKEYDNELNNLKQKIIENDHSLNEMVNNNACPTCMRKFESFNESKENIVRQLTSDNVSKKKRIDIVFEQILELKNKLNILDLKKTELVQLNLELEKHSIIKSEIEKKITEINIVNEKYKNITNKKQIMLKNIEEYQREIVEKDQQISKTEKIIEKASIFLQELIPFKQKMILLDQEISLEKDNKQKIELSNQNYHYLESNLKVKNDSLKKSQNEIEILKKQQNPYEEITKRYKNQIISLNNAIDEQQKYLNILLEDLKYLNFWKNGFAPTGIRSFITDDVIELLNKKTQDNLNELFNGSLSVIFEPESKSAKGVVSNKISTIFMLNGEECTWNSLSGGEKRRAILATNLAISDIAETRSGTKFNVRFLDEVFDGMDDSGQAKCLALFTKIARERDGFFIISHEEKLQNLCQKAMYIIKENKISKVVSQKEFNSIDFDHDKEDNSEIFKGLSKFSELNKLFE